MARYPALLGRRVEVQYRAGDIHLSASGTLVEEKDGSIYLEDRFSSKGKDKVMRVEIPYAHVIRISKSPEKEK